MQNLFLTQLSETEIRNLIREEFQSVLSDQPQAEQSNPKKILNFEEACTYLSISKSHGYKLTSKGLIPHSKRGKRIYFQKSELEQWLLSNKVETVSDMKQEMDNYLNGKREE